MACLLTPTLPRYITAPEHALFEVGSAMKKNAILMLTLGLLCCLILPVNMAFSMGKKAPSANNDTEHRTTSTNNTDENTNKDPVEQFRDYTKDKRQSTTPADVMGVPTDPVRRDDSETNTTTQGTENNSNTNTEDNNNNSDQ
jgi:hypothetical protein